MSIEILKQGRWLLLSVMAVMVLTYCKGSGNVDMSKAIKLQTEVVVDPVTGGVITGDGGSGPNGEQQLYDTLFDKNPNTWMKLGSFGAIDPVGTSLNQDFDGDGINNDKETTTNFWVADYPVVESEVAPPITMKITLLQTSNGETTEVSSDINSNDIESRKNEGSEKFHQNELAERTVQYEREVSESASDSSGSSSSNSSTSSSASASATGSASGGFGFSGNLTVEVDLNFNDDKTSEDSFQKSEERSSSERTQVFEDRPFKNNLDRASTSVKADSAAVNARKFRSEKRSKTTTGFTVQPNAGFVRAALFIKNQTVNMPVKISNILCSLLFETAEGAIIPIQSFRLRNDDFSPFEVEVYGASEFGPYVIELNGLNTAEIENAIALGHTPKIFIVDYDMTHVPDSNYKAALSNNFTGDNLKIIEENAKGRTALIKVIGPNFRIMNRVVAFDTQETGTDICDLSNIVQAGQISPGVTLSKALQRMNCSGMNIEFEHYVFDFNGTPLAPKIPRVYMYGVKSVNGVSNQIPCEPITGLSIQGTIDQEACLVRINNFDETDINAMALWTIADNGKFYSQTTFVKDGATVVTFDDQDISQCGEENQACGIPQIRGIESIIWAGDNYDMVYMRLSDLIDKVEDYGTNPLETGEVMSFNTKWDLDTVGENPFYPNVKSRYLGEVGPGDQIEITIQLENTFNLNPSFGLTSTAPDYVYSIFDYNLAEETSKLFTIDEAIDFELNIGLAGTQQSWVNLTRDLKSTPLVTEFGDCGRFWNFLKQEFTFCVAMPLNPVGVSQDGLLNVYLRPTLNNAYRNSIWPQKSQDIKRFSSILLADISIGDTVLEVATVSGSIGENTVEQGQLLKINDENRTIANVNSDGPLYLITTEQLIGQAYSSGASVSTTSGFSGQLKGDIITDTTTTIKIVGAALDQLPLGTELSGTSIMINGDSYTIAEVEMYNEAYTIIIEAGVLANHKKLEDVSLSAGLSFQTVKIAHDPSFFSDWNSTGGVGAYTVLAEDIGEMTCNTPFYSPNCMGYTNTLIVGNWIGGAHFENSWNDASLFENYLASSLNPFLTSSTNGTEFKLLTDVQDMTINENPLPNTFTTTIYSTTIVSADGMKTLVIWIKTTDFVTYGIAARLYDAKTAVALTPEIEVALLPSSGSTSNISELVLSGNKVVFAYTDFVGGFRNIFGRIFDFDTNSFVNTDGFQISDASSIHKQYPRIAVSGNIAVVSYMQCQNTCITDEYPSLVSARMIDVSNSTVLTAQHTFDSFTKMNDESVSIVATGNQAWLYWIHYAPGGGVNDGYAIWAAKMDLQNQTFGAVYEYYPDVGYKSGDLRAAESNGIVYTMWSRTGPGITGNYITGRSFNLANGEQGGMIDGNWICFPCGEQLRFQGNGKLEQFRLEAGDGRMLATWTGDDGQIYGRVADHFNGLSTSALTVISSEISSDRGYAKAVISGNEATVVWHSQVNSGYDVYSRKISMVGAPISTTKRINIERENDQIFPWIDSSNGSTMVVWYSTDGVIRGRLLSLDTDTIGTLGLLNFFTAPLIERDYTVTTKIKF